MPFPIQQLQEHGTLNEVAAVAIATRVQPVKEALANKKALGCNLILIPESAKSERSPKTVRSSVLFATRSRKLNFFRAALGTIFEAVLSLFVRKEVVLITVAEYKERIERGLK